MKEQYVFVGMSGKKKLYMAESKSGGMTTHYYNVPQASRDGVCIKLD